MAVDAGLVCLDLGARTVNTPSSPTAVEWSAGAWVACRAHTAVDLLCGVMRPAVGFKILRSVYVFGFMRKDLKAASSRRGCYFPEK